MHAAVAIWMRTWYFCFLRLLLLVLLLLLLLLLLLPWQHLAQSFWE
jgi:hypothetical protein